MRFTLIISLVLCCLRLTAQPTVALVLTGGGARGIAQIGVLKVFEKEGIVPEIIVGSSFGAIVGGLYAAGITAHQLDSVIRSVDWDEITSFSSDTKRETLFLSQKQEDDRSLLTLRFRNFEFVTPTAIGGSAKFSALIQELLWRSPYNSVTNFDELYCRFRAVTTNLIDGTAVSLDHGNLATAIRASATFPLRYAPVRWSADTLLVDGGLVSNIPVKQAKDLGAHIIVVVNTTSNFAPVSKLTTPWAVADQALTAAMKQRDSVQLAGADFVLTPDLGQTSTFEFENLDVLIRAGEREGQRIVEALKARIAQGQTDGKGQAPSSPIKDIRCTSTFSADTLSLVSQQLRRMSGGNWSARFRRQNLARINDALHAAGHDMAFVRSTTFDKTTNTLTIEIDEGRLTSIAMDNLQKLRKSDIEREVTFKAGEIVERSDLEQTWLNMHASDVLADVDITISRNEDSGVRAMMHAEDRGNQMLRLGARIDNERYTQVGLDLIHENLFSSGVRLALRGAISQRIGQISAAFELPRIGGTLWTAGIRGYSSFRDVWIYANEPAQPINTPNPQRVDEYSEDRYGFRISAGRQLERNGVILGEFRYEQQRYRDVDATTAPEFQPLATLLAIVRWDDRDHIDFATKGRTIDLFAESSLLSLSNSLSFTKFSAAISSATTIGAVTLIPSALVGAADRTLPSPELFSMGGQDAFFGMREDEKRGRQIVTGHLEARIKLPLQILFDSYASVRYDIGAIWENPENIRIADMTHGIGFTLGVDTPVGPARFSLGRSFFFLADPSAVAWGPVLAYFAIGARL